MKTSSYILIPSSSFGSDIAGTPQKAAAYYSKDKSVQTVSWYVTGFAGTITIEATLDADNTSENYFPIHTIEWDGMTPLTENDFANLTGNYTWIKATVTSFTQGNIGKVSIGY